LDIVSARMAVQSVNAIAVHHSFVRRSAFMDMLTAIMAVCCVNAKVGNVAVNS